ncbi:hypothetical protein RHGRI_013332 [Rhododendron griersonianum]|uniref:Uncharacterized protein n=1 Tax=Rhododendron griersonianum TaxID=479676 RepID=A0AAV6K554_9ERIC|nr:hypothetical protein RHGRI_013332 [Rhododendron griersonianum]
MRKRPRTSLDEPASTQPSSTFGDERSASSSSETSPTVSPHPRLLNLLVLFGLFVCSLSIVALTFWQVRLRLKGLDLVLRLDILKKLEKHRSCVNTVSFNVEGDILVSGSDDRRVILWDWESGRVTLSFDSGHINNVFQAKIIPYTEDRSIVTCAADGQFDLRTGASTQLFTCQSLRDRGYVPIVNLNAIAVDPRNPNLFAVAGSDEYTQLYDIRKYKWDGSTDFGQPTDYFCPSHLIGDEEVGITGLAFSDQSELLVSYNYEFIYLFARVMGLGPNPAPASPVSIGGDAGEMQPDHYSSGSPLNMDAEVKFGPQVYRGHKNCDTVKGVNFFGPKCEYVVSGSDCGRIFIWKKKGGELIRVMHGDKDVVNCIESHPHTSVLASSGIEKDIKIWTPKALDRATLPPNIQKVYFVIFK